MLKIYDETNKKTYKIYVSKNKKIIKQMINYFNEFIKLKLKKYIGIDLEFNKVSKTERDVALIQLNLETDNKNEGVIFILDPKLLNLSEKTKLIELLTSEEIIKVLHGGESLDIPYLYNQLFDNNIELIKKFSKRLYDTKYLCEYNHIIKNVKEKCTIYDLYKEYNVITKEKYNYLNDIENITGPIYLVKININNMTEKILEYVVYDVLYLISLYKKLNVNELVSDIARNIFYYKRIPDEKYNKIFEGVKKYNNYFIIKNNQNVKLIDIYNFINKKMSDNILIKLLEITYFKAYLETLYKYIIYSSVSKKHDIFKSKNEKKQIKKNKEKKIIFGDILYKFIKEQKKNIYKLL